MLKLPKGLKKKKKGKKSKKDQELFTEAELEQYKREHQAQSEPTAAAAAEAHHPEKAENDDEWSKFQALTTGVDSILKKTQGDLDRIKSTSFFKRVAPPCPQRVEEKVAEPKVEEKPEEEVEKDPSKLLLNAVVELSDSEEDSEDDDSAFDTTFTTQELPLAYVPESPEDETALGPDPFDTGYADKLIKGPEVSTRGKKIVNIGAAVEVLTGRVDNASTTKTRRQRRGIQNLLLESFEANLEDAATGPAPDLLVATNLLDEPSELGEDIPIDLSVSLHLPLLKKREEEKESSEKEDFFNVVAEFDDLKATDEDDGFSQIAAESSTKDKPQRPKPPTRPAQPSNLQILLGEEESEEEEGEDPFDTAYVEKIVPKSIDYDDDFDPRALAEETEAVEDNALLKPSAPKNKPPPRPTTGPALPKKDLLSTSHTDLANIAPTLAPSADIEDEEVESDPFDTSAVNALVAPGKTELKYLERELLERNEKASLSDDDFDPRAGEELKPDFDSLKQRKSSLSLHLPVSCPKLVSFIVSTPDLLRVDAETSGKNPKPLTPYYNREPSVTFEEEAVEEDPFDTSFVPSIAPSTVELDIIEKEILKTNTLTLSHSLSDQDFDPRAVTPQPDQHKADLFLVADNHNIKVLTPAKESNSSEEAPIDPFDTSIAVNILPGSVELKLLEEELIEKKPELLPSSDIISDTQDNSIYAKILTPQPSESFDVDAQEDFDPFDTSFAANLAPGEVEIQLIENELIN